jgi:glucose/arabinose dehydrogenase
MHRSTRTGLTIAGIGVVFLAVILAVRAQRSGPPTPTPAESTSASSEPLSSPAAPTESSLPRTNVPVPFPLHVPDGFAIGLYASGFKKPRVLALDPSGTVLVSDQDTGQIVALPDDNRDGTSDQQLPVLSGLRSPHGIAFRGNDLYVAETHRVVRYAYDPARRAASDPRTIVELPSGGGHSTRTIGFGRDGMLYVSVGSSCNVCREADERRAAILRVDVDTGKSERWAWGLRNTVFFTFHPETGAMLGNDMGRDLLGDNVPPDELNVITGGDYGWPFCSGKRIADPFGKHPKGCEQTEPSLYDYPAHVAPLGIQFVPKEFSEEWAGDLLVAFHGSWNRSSPIGYEVVRLDLDGDRVAAKEPFLTGFLSDSGRTLGRPAGLLFLPDGSLLVSDDHAGVIYRLTPTR